jgi:mRNA interferase RelE/StbE
MLKIRYSKQARLFLLKIPNRDAVKIRDKIEQYSIDPASQKNNIKKLVGANVCRLRVGDYRVIFDVDGNILDIIKVAHRKDVYK